MEKSRNELIDKRRRKIRIKRTFFLIILLISILITLSLKLPYFQIKKIIVYQNRTISSSDIIKEAKIKKDSNIFYMNVSKIKKNILDNPYILDADIKRKIPNTVEITVRERKAIFYAEKGKSYLIIDRNGIALEERNSIDNMNLIKITGFNVNTSKVGRTISCDDSRKLNAIKAITDLVINDGVSNITMVDINDGTDLKVYFKDMCVKLGTNDKLVDKLNEAINIINNQNLITLKGYVDVSFDGNPVFFIQK